MASAEVSQGIDQTEIVLASLETQSKEVMAHLLGSVALWDGKTFQIERAGIIAMQFVPAPEAPVEQLYESWPVRAEARTFTSARPLPVARLKLLRSTGKTEVVITSPVVSSYTKDYSRHHTRSVRIGLDEIRSSGHRFLVSPIDSEEP